METKAFILSDHSGGKSFQIETKRYRFLDNKNGAGRRGVILVLMAGNGFSKWFHHNVRGTRANQHLLDKETWEPFLDDLRELQQATGSSTYVKEAWTFDSPNFGRTAVLNDQQIYTPAGALVNVSKCCNMSLLIKMKYSIIV